MKTEHPGIPKSPTEILADFDLWKKTKTAEVKFRMVKDYGLESDVAVAIETIAGPKISVVTFTHKGLTAKFKISNSAIILESSYTLNDDDVSAIEDHMKKDFEQILTDYFSANVADRPE